MVIRELVWKITGDSSAAEKALKSSDAAGAKTATTFSKLKVAAVAVGVAILGVGVALQRIVSNQLDAIDTSAKLADRLGITMEAMGGLEHIANLSGNTVEGLGVGIQMLTLRMGEAETGTGNARAAIESLGLSFNEIRNLAPEQAMYRLAGALQNVESSTQQTYIANELFGRQGRALLGVIRSSGSELQNMADEASRLGLTMSREAAAGVERFNDQMARISAVGTGMLRQFTVQISPALNEFADALFGASQDGDLLTTAMNSFANAATIAIRIATRLVESFKKIREYSDVIDKVLRFTAIGALREMGTDTLRLLGRLTGVTDTPTTAPAGERPPVRPRTRTAPAGPTGGAGGESAEERRRRLRIAEQLKRSAIELANVTSSQEIMEQKLNALYQQRIGLLTTANEVAQAGLQIVSALGSLSAAQNQAKLDNLEAELQAELASKGLLEETQVEQAQREYDAALALGDAVQLEEKRRQLEKAKVEEEYRKKKAKLEYQAAMDAYKFRMIEAAAGVPLAIMSGLISGWRAPWPLGAVFGPLYGALAGAAAGIQLAAVRAGKPQAPKFATGGIVPGNSYAGDTVSAQVNSGEMVLNNQQQSRLFQMANGAGAVQQIMIYLGGQKIYDEFHRASSDGRLLIDARAVV